MPANPLQDLVFIPRWLGQPLYPGGFPIRPQDIRFEGLSAFETYIKYGPSSNWTYTEDELQFLKEYMIYHLHAPCWSMIGDISSDLKKAREAALSIKTKQDLNHAIWLSISAGIDPF